MVSFAYVAFSATPAAGPQRRKLIKSYQMPIQIFQQEH